MMYHFKKRFRDFSSFDNSSEREVFENEYDCLSYPDFSSSDSSGEWKVFENDYLYCVFQKSLLFYANGNREENKGYVSIIFNETFLNESIESDNLEEVEVRYFFSVVDISGKKRFTQSIVQFLGKTAPRESENGSRGNFDFGMERYLKRETLLNDPTELLPGDCLTISVEIDYINRSPLTNDLVELPPFIHQHNIRQVDYIIIYPNRHCIVEFFFIDENCGLCIPLDTFYGKKLCSLSGFFQRASETPLIEARTREVHIPVEEVSAFTNVLNILFKQFSEVYLKSIEDVCQLFVLAHMYDFQSVIETCRQFIKAFLCTTEDFAIREHVTQSLPDIIELANKYSDSDLIDTVETYLESKKSFGTNDDALQKYLKERLFADWKCVSRNIRENPSGDDDIHIFVLTRIAEPKYEINM